MMRKILERVLRRFVTDDRYQTLDPDQVESYTDLIALAMVIDRHIAQIERDEVARLLERFEWPDQRPSEHFINRSVRRAWDLIDSPTPSADVLQFCKRVAERLQDDWIREAAFVAVVRVVSSDDQVVDHEVELLEHLREAFDFDEERVAILRERAHEQAPTGADPPSSSLTPSSEG